MKPSTLQLKNNYLTQSLITYFTFFENSGNIFNVLKDLTDYKNNGTILGNNPIWKNKTVTFDGNSERMDVLDSNTFNVSNVSFLIWIKVLSTSAFESVGIKSTSSAWTDGWGMYISNTNSLNFFINHWNNNKASLADYSPYINEWKFLAGVYDKNKIKLYLDGELINETVYTVNMTTTSHALEIARGNGNVTCLNGTYDQFMIFNTALSAYDIKRLYLKPYMLLDTQERSERTFIKKGIL